ncbi:hypothetical protein [Lentisalinibacter sediminis]|uniref:hypothetical protein n=1 Tax=Lentisalinibacter sediminis TaxID=2992237 RepID=UPI003865CB8F
MNFCQKATIFVLSTIAAAASPAQTTQPTPEPPTLFGAERENTPLSTWRLPSGHFTPAKMPIHLVYPRPDAETASWARQKRAYPGLEYRIPVVVQGGAYPYRYQVVSGPSGMTVGEKYGDANYGIASWTPAEESGPQQVSIRVTDQQDSFVDVKFSIEVTRKGFIFLDPNVATSGDGSIGNPLKTFADVHKGSQDDRTYAGNILYLRGGTHKLTGWAGNNGNFNVKGDNKPQVWLAYPGEEVVVDASSAGVYMLEGNSGNDMFMHGFRMINSRADLSNSRFFWFGGENGSRSTFFELHFENLVRGTSGTDNPGAIVKFRGNSHVEYWAIIGCSIEEYDAPLVGSFYATRYVVVDNNVLGASTMSYVDQGIFAKAASDFWSVRGNVSTLQNFSYGALENLGSSSEYGPQRLEFAYNKLYVPDSGSMAIVYNWTTGEGDPGNSVWIYRNTVVGEMRGLGHAVYEVVIENNVVLNKNGIQESGSTRTVTERDNLIASRSALTEVLDADYRLQGKYRDQYLGTHGHEISE